MASRVVRARLDLASEKALESLVLELGTESEVVRTALIEAARVRRKAMVREEVARLAADPEDSLERKALLEDLEDTSPIWPK